MYSSLIPDEFKKLLDPVWMQQREKELLDLIESEIKKEQSIKRSIENINKAFDLLTSTIKKNFITLSSSNLQAAQKTAYEKAGIEKYQITAIVDSNTCEKCFEMNDKIFMLKDYAIGKTAPTFHYSCRCTTVPYINYGGSGNGVEGERKGNPTKGESEVWKDLDNVKGKDRKTSGSGSGKRYYEWDHTHNDIEVYDKNGKHLGSMEPTTGEIYKPPVNGRTIKP